MCIPSFLFFSSNQQQVHKSRETTCIKLGSTCLFLACTSFRNSPVGVSQLFPSFLFSTGFCDWFSSNQSLNLNLQGFSRNDKSGAGRHLSESESELEMNIRILSSPGLNEYSVMNRCCFSLLYFIVSDIAL